MKIGDILQLPDGTQQKITNIQAVDGTTIISTSPVA